MAKRKKKIDEAVQASLAGVEDIEMRIEAMRWAMKPLWERMRNRTPDRSLQQAMDLIWKELYQEAAHRYRSLFMWGVFDDRARHEARRMAMKRFLSENSSIMGYLDKTGFPFPYRADGEKLFREEIEALRKEVEDEH